MSSVEKAGIAIGKRTMKSAKEELFRWICEKRATNSFLDMRMIREKALDLTNTRRLNGFKCSNKWITGFLKEHGFSVDPANLSGPIFGNYRDWIDLMRSTIIKYKHSDLFHADELTMFSDIPPTSVTANETDSACSPGNRITVLMGCNSSGTAKLPLLICGSYPCKITTKEHVYCHSEDCYISDDLFRNWLSRLDDRMSRCDRKILLFLRQSRARALKDLPLTNVNLLYFPEGFPPLLRPLRRDVFHYVKMMFRRSYVERMSQYTVEWKLRDVLESLIDAWETLPREIIVCSFQRTHFRTDDSFLQISCDCWAKLKMGISFKRFVTFDDNLSDKQASPVESNVRHEYNLRPSCKDVLHVNEDSADSAAGKEKESPTPDRDYRATLLDSRSNTDKKLGRSVATNRDRIREDKNQGGKRKRSGVEVVERSGDRGKLRNETYSEIHFAAKGQTGNRRVSADRVIKNAFASKDLDVSPSRSIAWEPFEREALQRRPTERRDVTGSMRATIDKALSLTTSAKAHYAKKLIDSIYAARQEAMNDADCQAESKNLNREDSGESICINEEAAGPTCENTTEESLRKIFSSSSELCQPSTSTKDCDWNTSSKIKSSFETVDASLLKESSPIKELESDEGNRTLPGQGSQPASSVREETLKFSGNKRQKSTESSSSGNASDGEGPREKKLKTDCNWSKQFETTFVFGPTNTSDTGNCYSQHQRDENIADSCIFHSTPSVSPKD